MEIELTETLSRLRGAPEHRIVCAWCQKTMHPAPPGSPVSHGMCRECQKEMNDELDTEDGE